MTVDMSICRYVEMSDNLLAWLNSYKLMEGEISPAKLYRARLTALARACSLSPWPKDVLRHGFASYWLAKHKDEAKLKHLMGHHQMSDMLKRHYINLISLQDAEIYWEITPGRSLK